MTERKTYRQTDRQTEGGHANTNTYRQKNDRNGKTDKDEYIYIYISFFTDRETDI